jgi:predicted small integral membrane protein
MLVIRLAKVMVIAALAAFTFLVTYDNIVDYGSNYQFVQHVLSMDTTFPDNALRSRAITDPRLWQAAYAAIIAAEGVTCLLLAIGATPTRVVIQVWDNAEQIAAWAHWPDYDDNNLTASTARNCFARW